MRLSTKQQYQFSRVSRLRGGDPELVRAGVEKFRDGKREGNGGDESELVICLLQFCLNILCKLIIFFEFCCCDHVSTPMFESMRIFTDVRLA